MVPVWSVLLGLAFLNPVLSRAGSEPTTEEEETEATLERNREGVSV